MTPKQNILNLTYQVFCDAVAELGLPKFRATQIFEWIYKKHTFNFAAMTNVSQSDRDVLAQYFEITLPQVDQTQDSADGSTKFLLKAQDGRLIESILMRVQDRRTLCVSSMVGCPLKCRFCATGSEIGFIRNLEAAEIIGQVLAAESFTGEKVSNIVFMGMGEPLLNREALEVSLDLLLDKKAVGLAPARITISSAGIVPAFSEVINKFGVRPALSLHFPTGAQRSEYMPVNRGYPLAAVLADLKKMHIKPRDHITIEYIMLCCINDTEEHAHELARILRGLHVLINLIPYNPTATFDAQPSTAAQMDLFIKVLIDRGLRVTVRRSAGTDVDGGCGQFALRREAFLGKVGTRTHCMQSKCSRNQRSRCKKCDNEKF
ncbi:MAG: putative dual-specificity RNA methyltransferase RlmN [candidate division TM6 bacterium GW2011_GWE2_41_16]|nr:MAG: putative dual-specificity RNA methyltransferase RlmN [candidate division TM6 bacterium GW2011_GWE2_41_16]